MTISVDCRVGAKVTPRNDRNNIAFTGLQEDMKLSREIVENFSQKYGRLRSYPYVTARMKQHENDSRYAKIWDKLKIVREEYAAQVGKARGAFFKWYNEQNSSSLNWTDVVKKIKELLLSKKIGNCEEHAVVIQDEHLQRGIEVHNILLKIFNRETLKYLGGHVISLRNLDKNADLENPKTWGKKAILIDSWCGAGKKRGIVEIAEDGLADVLEFLCFDPKKEIVLFYKADQKLAEEFIAKMKAQKSKICTEK